VAWDFLSSIYESGCDILMANKNNRSFRQCVVSQFNVKPIKTTNQNLNHNSLTKGKQASISKVSLPIPPRPSKSILAKSKYFKKNFTTNTDNKSTNYSYAQASKNSIK